MYVYILFFVAAPSHVMKCFIFLFPLSDLLLIPLLMCIWSAHILCSVLLELSSEYERTSERSYCLIAATSVRAELFALPY